MLPLTNALGDIAHVIQLAIAPVFLLNALGALVGVLTNRLSRIVDRLRVLEETDFGLHRDPVLVAEEVGVLERRMRMIYMALGLDVTCALCVGLLIALAFVDALVRTDLAVAVAVLFVAAMLAFIGSMVLFLREIFLAVRRFPQRKRVLTETTLVAAPGATASRPDSGR